MTDFHVATGVRATETRAANTARVQQLNRASQPRVVTGSRSLVMPSLMRRPATLDAFVLAGEEIPDLFQRLATEHPDTDEYVRSISRYHRLEEARHLAYARATVGEHYEQATWSDR